MSQYALSLGIYLEVHFSDVKAARGHPECKTSLSELPEASTAPREY